MVENSIQLQPTHATVVTDNTQLPKSQIAPKWQGNLPQMPSYQKKRHLVTYSDLLNHIYKIQGISPSPSSYRVQAHSFCWVKHEPLYNYH